MYSIVCMKQVSDTEAQIRVKSDGTDVVLDGVKFIISPYDEFGIEEALRIKEKMGAGKVSLVSLGPARCVESIRTGLAMGADDAYLIFSWEGALRFYHWFISVRRNFPDSDQTLRGRRKSKSSRYGSGTEPAPEYAWVKPPCRRLDPASVVPSPLP